MFMHHPRLQLLRSALSDPLAGDIRRVESSFSFDGRGDFMKTDIRVKANGDPLGALVRSQDNLCQPILIS